MNAAGFIKHDKYNKSYTITCVKKNKSKRKKIYICERTLRDYLFCVSKKKQNSFGDMACREITPLSSLFLF